MVLLGMISPLPLPGPFTSLLRKSAISADRNRGSQVGGDIGRGTEVLFRWVRNMATGARMGAKCQDARCALLMLDPSVQV
jgi:hypothetical protein